MMKVELSFPGNYTTLARTCDMIRAIGGKVTLSFTDGTPPDQAWVKFDFPLAAHVCLGDFLTNSMTVNSIIFEVDGKRWFRFS